VAFPKREFLSLDRGAWKPAYNAGSHISTATTAAGSLSAIKMNPAKIAGLVRFLHRTVFFKLMEERYRRHPTIITSNLDYEEWPNLLGNRPMAEALLSRLRHYCHTVRIQGPPLREPQG